MAVVLLLVAVSPSRAQVLRVEVTGKPLQTVASGTQITVDLSNLSGVVLVHIYDPTFAPDGSPVGSAGKIILGGTVGTLSGISEVRVLVAGEDDVWPTNFTQALLTSGIRDLGTSTSAGIEVGDASLRAKTRLAAYTSGNIRGDITVGQVQRIQCGFDLVNPTPGIVYANITTTAKNIHVPPSCSDCGDGFTAAAIAYIKAGNAIVGNVTATSDAVYRSDDAFTFATIGKIIVGPSEQAAGIQGDIKAEQGIINSIYTAGPIGGTSAITGQNRTPKVWAGTGIREIICTTSESPSVGVGYSREPLSTVAAPIQAAIDSARAVIIQGRPGRDGALSVIETGGDIAGTIHAANLTSPEVSGVSSGAVAGVRAGRITNGTLVGGRILASITVDHVMEGSIIAQSIEAPISIGRQFEGTILAYGGLLAGTATPAPVPLISIGFDEPLASAGAYSAQWGRGFIGTDLPCVSGQAFAYPRPDIASDIRDMFVGALSCQDDAGEPGVSLIAATQVNDLRISRVSVWERARGRGSTPSSTRTAWCRGSSATVSTSCGLTRGVKVRCGRAALTPRKGMRTRTPAMTTRASAQQRSAAQVTGWRCGFRTRPPLRSRATCVGRCMCRNSRAMPPSASAVASQASAEATLLLRIRAAA